MEIDILAKEKALRYGMPVDVHIPIGARQLDSITRFIGNIMEIESIPVNKAFLVSPHQIPKLNPKLPLWKLSESSILHSEKQLWVHVDYKGYRSAFIKSFPDQDIKGYFIDHILNRRVARLKAYEYLRVIPVYPRVNTSSGGVTEKYGYDYHNSPAMKLLNAQNKAQIEYADLADLVKMLNYKTGGKFQDIVNECQELLIEG